MYNKAFLLESLDSLLESANHKLNTQELDVLLSIRNHIEENNDDDKLEKQFFALVNFLLLIKEYLEKIT